MLKNYQEFIPKFYFCLRKYSLSTFKKDLLSGIRVAIVAIPLAMAFAVASGVDPSKGLVTAIVAGFFISFLGGSKVLIGGPTGAFVAITYNIISRHGYDGLVIATIIAGILLILMGLFRWGFLIKFVPHPLVAGFTTGIALVLFTSQIKDLLGLNIENTSIQFLSKWNQYLHAFPSFDGVTAAVGIGTLLSIFLIRHYFRNISWEIAVLLLATIFCWCFDLNIPTVASRFGQLPLSLTFSFPTLDFSRALDVMPDAITISLLAGMESLVCAVIADTATGGRNKPNCELVAQGVANIGSVLLGGIPATATIARTAVNIKTGAQTPFSGILHSGVILFLLWACSPLVALIPLASLSAILVIVSWNMSNVSHFFRLMKTSKGDVVILLTAFSLTVLINLIVAVEVGMLLAAFLFMNRMSEVKHVIALDRKKPEEEIEIYRMRGPFFFGVADRLKTVFHEMEKPPKIFIIRMKHVPVLDATALQTLKELNDQCVRKNTLMVLTEVQAEPAELLGQYGLSQLINQNILQNCEEKKSDATAVIPTPSSES